MNDPVIDISGPAKCIEEYCRSSEPKLYNGRCPICALKRAWQLQSQAEDKAAELVTSGARNETKLQAAIKLLEIVKTEKPVRTATVIAIEGFLA